MTRYWGRILANLWRATVCTIASVFKSYIYPKVLGGLYASVPNKRGALSVDLLNRGAE